MRLVISNSEAEVVHKRELGAIHATLRDLAANLLRVTRGAGRPYELANQAVAFVNACVAFREATGAYPMADEIAAALDLNDEPEWIRELEGTERALYDAKYVIIRGALQIVASEFLGQRTQVAAGSHELADGIRDHQAAIKAMRELRRKVAEKPHTVVRSKSKPSRKNVRPAPEG